MRAVLRTPFKASSTDICPLTALSALASTSSAGGGEVGSSPSDCIVGNRVSCLLIWIPIKYLQSVSGSYSI